MWGVFIDGVMAKTCHDNTGGKMLALVRQVVVYHGFKFHQDKLLEVQVTASVGSAWTQPCIKY